MRKGSFLIIKKRNKIQKYKIQKDSNNNEFIRRCSRKRYVSKTGRFIRKPKSSRRGSRKRRFGMTPLSNIMGPFTPAEMSIFQSYTGMSPAQASKHLENIPLSVRSNFYTSV